MTGRRLSAVSTFVIIVLAATLVLILDAWLVRRDGYGRRPAPRSHESWSLGNLPSAPYGTPR